MTRERKARRRIPERCTAARTDGDGDQPTLSIREGKRDGLGLAVANKPPSNERPLRLRFVAAGCLPSSGDKPQTKRPWSSRRATVVIVLGAEEYEGRGERAGADAGDDGEFRPTADFGPSPHQSGGEGPVLGAARERQQASVAPRVMRTPLRFQLGGEALEIRRRRVGPVSRVRDAGNGRILDPVERDRRPNDGARASGERRQADHREHGAHQELPRSIGGPCRAGFGPGNRIKIYSSRLATRPWLIECIGAGPLQRARAPCHVRAVGRAKGPGSQEDDNRWFAR